MVKVTAWTCIDALPVAENEADPEWPLLGVSGVRELYLYLDRTWDAETLCAERGKRLCTASEWALACYGTRQDACQPRVQWTQPNWHLVMVRDADELARLDYHADPYEWRECVSPVGARLMGYAEEWVQTESGPRMTLGYWGRDATCEQLNMTHGANWHSYASAARCCYDVRL